MRLSLVHCCGGFGAKEILSALTSQLPHRRGYLSSFSFKGGVETSSAFPIEIRAIFRGLAKIEVKVRLSPVCVADLG